MTARDAFGNLATGYTGTVSFASTDAQADLPGSYTFTAADAGTHTFSATLKTRHLQHSPRRSIVVSDIANASLRRTSAGILVLPGVAQSLHRLRRSPRR